MTLSARTLLLVLLVFALTACGGSIAGLNNIPLYPDAKEISQSESKLFDGLTQVAKIDTNINRALNGKDHKIYRLPDQTAWADVKLFYEKGMDKSSWQIIPSPSMLTEKVTLPKEISAYQTLAWVRGSQTFAIALVSSPVATELYISLWTP